MALNVGIKSERTKSRVHERERERETHFDSERKRDYKIERIRVRSKVLS